MIFFPYPASVIGRLCENVWCVCSIWEVGVDKKVVAGR